MPPITDSLLQMMEQGNSYMKTLTRNIDQLARNGDSNTMMSEIREGLKNTEMSVNMCFSEQNSGFSEQNSGFSEQNSGIVLSSNTIMLFTIFVIIWKYLY